MDIPVTIATIVAVEYSQRIPAFVDYTETFLFFGEPTQEEIDDVHQCVAEVVMARTEEHTNIGIFIELASQLKTSQAVCIEYPEGHVSTHWNKR